MSSNDTTEIQPFLDKRFQHANTIPGTRDNHCSVPTSLSSLKLYRMSSKLNERRFECSHETKAFVSRKMLKVSTFVAIVYDNRLFIAIIEDVSTENQDALVKFMSPAVPAPSFTWPRHEEICWVGIVGGVGKIPTT